MLFRSLWSGYVRPQDKGCVQESGKLSESSSPTRGVRESGKPSKKFFSPPRDQRVGSCRCSSPPFGVGMSVRQGMCPRETIKKFLPPHRDQRVGSCRCSSPHFGVGMSVRQGMCSGEWETIRKFLSSRVSREWETVEAPLPRLQEGPCVTTHTVFTSLPTGGPITRGSLPSHQEAEYSFSEFIPTIKQKNKKISES